MISSELPGAHQRVGTKGSLSGRTKFLEAQEEYPCTIAHGQQGSFILYQPHGGYPVKETVSDSLGVLGVVHKQGNYSPCSTPPREDEPDSRLQIQALSELKQMDDTTSSFQGSGLTLWPLLNSPICRLSEYSINPLLQLET